MVIEDIPLLLNSAGIDKYCRDLVRHISRVEKRVVALDALQTFIAAMTEPGEQAKSEFVAIRETLERHFEQARTALQTEQAAALVEALKARRLSRITPIYQALSRDAFWQLLSKTEETLGREVCAEIGHWSGEWLAQVKERSEQLSPYPDTIDFKAVGIDVAEYAAMSDICKYFSCQ
jgi:hypothetical protein